MATKEAVNKALAKSFLTQLDGVACIVFAETRSKAQYTVLKSANSAGYNYPFLGVSKIYCRRRPKFDVLNLEEGRCYSLEYVNEKFDKQALSIFEALKKEGN